MSAGNSNEGRGIGPRLTHGRVIDRSSPFLEDRLPVGSLYIADLGYLDWGAIAARRAAGSYTLTRAQARTNYWTPEGKRLELDALLPQQVGQTHERSRSCGQGPSASDAPADCAGSPSSR